MYRTLTLLSASLRSRSASAGGRALRTLAVASLAGFGMLALTAGNASALTDFSGLYDPVNWTLMSLGNGSVDTTGAPGSIELFSSNTGVSTTINTDYTAVAIGAGQVMFDWDFTTTAMNPDSFYYLDHLGEHLVTAVTGTGSTMFDVAMGETFGFRIKSDNVNGPSHVTISNFCAPVPEPSAALVFGLGLGVVGCAVRQRRSPLVEGSLAS
jgi:hypothetical protein